MPILSASALGLALKGAQRIPWASTTGATTVSGTPHTLWDRPGTRPAAGSLNPGNTTSGVLLDSTSTGAIPFVNAPASKNQYIGLWEQTATVFGTVFLYDRMWHAGSYAATATTTFSLTGQPALTRPDANGVGAQIWLEVSTAFTAAATTINVTYTNSAGVTGQTSNTITMGQSFTTAAAVAPIIGRMFPLSWASGDAGVRKIESVVVGGTADTTGAFNVIIAQPIAQFAHSFGPGMGGISTMRQDAWQLGMPQVPDNACLAMMLLAQSTSSGVQFGELLLVSD